ncbi:MAG TPA: hypothetical protein ACFE0H_16195 [Elainellaceae cyanobacterium]|jgi:hypothetical protein
MHTNIESIFDDAENRYLKPDELGVLNQYVDSLPDRLDTYRHLRDQEVAIMQPVANQLEAQFPQASTQTLERSIKTALLIMRYCAMAMLLNDEAFLPTRLSGWFAQPIKIYNTERIDETLYQLLDRRLGDVLTPSQMNLIRPHLVLAQEILLGQPNTTFA